MALASTEVTTSAYVKIGDNVSTITFQCQSGNPVVINFTATNSAPTQQILDWFIKPMKGR